MTTVSVATEARDRLSLRYCDRHEQDAPWMVTAWELIRRVARALHPTVRALRAESIADGSSYLAPLPTPTTDDLIDAIRQVRSARAELDQLETELLRAARSGDPAEGRQQLTWAVIAEASGQRSEQAAAQYLARRGTS